MFLIAHFHRRRFAVAPVIAFIVFSLAHSGAASAQTVSLEDAMQGLSTSIVSYLKARNEKAIIIGDFKGPADQSGEIGNHAGMRRRLMERIKTAGIDIKTRQALRIDGEFSRDDANGTIDVSVTMFDRNRKPVQEFNELGIQVKISDLEDVIAAAGATVARPENSAAAAKAVKTAIQKPSFETLNPVGSIVAPNKSTPYRVELLARPAGQGDYVPRPVVDKNGLAFCPIGRNEEYAVKMYNDSPYDCAVKLTLDGINCFEFSEIPQFRSLGMWIIPAGKDLTVRGWHVSNQRSDSFLVVPSENSCVAQLGQDASKLGTVTACFFAAWDGTQAPPIEPAGSRGDGTARGPARPEAFTTVERYIGKTMQAAVSIRYAK